MNSSACPTMSARCAQRRNCALRRTVSARMLLGYAVTGEELCSKPAAVNDIGVQRCSSVPSGSRGGGFGRRLDGAGVGEPVGGAAGFDRLPPVPVGRRAGTTAGQRAATSTVSFEVPRNPPHATPVPLIRWLGSTSDRNPGCDSGCALFAPYCRSRDGERLRGRNVCRDPVAVCR